MRMTWMRFSYRNRREAILLRESPVFNEAGFGYFGREHLTASGRIEQG